MSVRGQKNRKAEKCEQCKGLIVRRIVRVLCGLMELTLINRSRGVIQASDCTPAEPMLDH